MNYKFITDRLTYTGEQLRGNFAYSAFDVIGDSIIAFCGKCDIRPEKIVDIADQKTKSKIFSELMLHFIVEHHDTDLEKAVLRQLVLADIAKDSINTYNKALSVKRIGSDLYDADAKLSVSVATVSPVSALIHFGINVISTNTPVKTKGLRDYDIEPQGFANGVMEQYAKEHEDIYTARCKVRWVE